MTDAVVIVQARFSSSRLAGKVLRPIAERPMLLHVLERAAAIGVPVILATSDNQSDNVIADVARAAGFDVARGSEHDVLDRFVRAAPRGARFVVRVTADCPLLDPAIARAVLQVLRESGVDYVSNVLEPSFPDGLDCEALTVSALRRAWEEAVLRSDREHVTTHIRRQPDRFRLWGIRHIPDCSDERWTVDDARDLEFVQAVYERLPTGEERTSMYSVLDVLRREPSLRQLNRGTDRNEGLARDIEAERRGVTARAAMWEDRRRLFEWANDPETRRNSFDPRPIRWEQHLAWLRERLDERPPTLYVGVVEGHPFGVVRFVDRDGVPEVGVTIDPMYRGKSLATPLLEAARRVYAHSGSTRIRARVKTNNLPSRRAFERAGYRVIGEADGVLEMELGAD